MRRWLAASLLVIVALYGLVARQPGTAALVGVVASLALLTRLELRAGLGWQRVLTAIAAAAGIAVGWLRAGPPGAGGLDRPWAALALAGLFAGVARLFLPDTRAAFALLPGLVALLATGETSVGRLYGVAVVAWLGCGLAALRAGDPGRPPLRDLPRRDLLLGGALVGLAVAFAAGSVAGLPPLSLWTERRVLRALGGAQTGFSERLWLGSMDGMLDSDEVVMRLVGPRTDYLRGAVFDHYEIGRWGRMRPAGARPAAPSGPREGQDRVRIEVVAGARDRYFLPLGASAVWAAGSGLLADRFGVLRVDGGAATEISFAPDGPAAFPPEAPGPDDLDIPPALRRPLRRIAGEWTAGATTPGAKVAAIAARLLRDFTYSRTFERRRADPLLDFLLDDRRGHCEYFATAVTLLARAADVPARMVVGYRVAEENELGRYWVVREKNAHAWAEFHLPDRGFVPVDATPPDLLAQNAVHATSPARALLDLVSATLSRALARLTLLDAAFGGMAVIALGLVVRWWRARLGGRRQQVERLGVDRPPPTLLRLLAALDRRGVVRGETEPIERFAARVDEAGLAEAAELLRRWAAWRYGGVGDPTALEAHTGEVARALRGR